MTNPIAKAIAKIGVAMGYGKLEDYKGSSVEDMLENFASIAQEKGPSGSGYNPYIVEIVETESSASTTADFNTAKSKFLAYEPVLAKLSSPVGLFIVNFSIYIPSLNGVEGLVAEISDGAAIRFTSDGAITID